MLIPTQVSVNASYSMAGHVPDAFFELQTSKKLTTLLWFAEPMLHNIRDPNLPNFTNEYT